MKYIKLDNDKWDDVGKVWFVHEYKPNPDSTSVRLTLEDTNTGEIYSRVVPQNQIEWLEAKDW